MSSELIPYTVEERADTGLYNAKFGIWLFLASEVMLFGSLISSYIILRTGSPSWPQGSSILNVPMATFNTMILISSSISIVYAWAALKNNDLKKFRIFMFLTILAGVIFLSIKGVEYSTKFHHHLFPSKNTFLAIYFTMTGAHALHLIGGVIVNSYMLLTSGVKFKENPQRFTNRIEVAGLYWHFVDLVWIFLFPLLYLS
jgi:heme/copper-type cytochrome/quinol oxidase subunit 3